MVKTKLLVIWIIVIFSASGCGRIAETAEPDVGLSPCEPHYYERLESYLSRTEIEPTQIINNKSGDNSWKPRIETVQIEKNTVEWTVKGEGTKLEFGLKINGHLIALAGRSSINNADGDQKIELADLGNWDQIRFYELLDEDVIAITLVPISCTGLMCSVSVQLYFGVKTKQATFFGSYRTDSEAKLYSFNGGNESFALGKNFDGDPHGGSISSVTYEAYKIMPNGTFEIRKNAKGEKYFIKHTRQPDGSKKPDTLEQKWIRSIDLR